MTEPMAPKDAAHHACLDHVLTSYACHQRILRFTPWNVNIWCIVSEPCERHEYNDISWTSKRMTEPMAPKDAAHHACLDRVLILYACHQRILTFTPWNVNIWCIVSEPCERHEYNDISWTSKRMKAPMAPKDAAHHTCLDHVLILYACHQRILRFTP